MVTTRRICRIDVALDMICVYTYNVVSRLLIREALEFLGVVRFRINKTPGFSDVTVNERAVTRFKILRSLYPLHFFFFGL